MFPLLKQTKYVSYLHCGCSCSSHWGCKLLCTYAFHNVTCNILVQSAQLQRELLSVVENDLPQVDTTDLLVKASAKWEDLSVKICKLATIEAASNQAFRRKLEEQTNEKESRIGTCTYILLWFRLITLH